MTKICSKCGKELDICNFTKDKQKPDGRRPDCKLCKREQSKKHYEDNKPIYAQKAKIYRENNKEKLSQIKKNNREKYNQQLRNWKKNNPEKWKAWLQTRIKKVRETPKLRILKNLRNRFRLAILNDAKSGHTLDILGCSIEDFKIYLESKFLPDMTWENYGRWKVGEPMKWHIDHIKSCDNFDLSDPEQQKICFHYTNMQPLWAIDNIKKSNS